MKTQIVSVAIVVALVGCTKDVEPNAELPSKVEPTTAAAATSEKAGNTVVDVAVGSKDHTTLVAALKAADLVVSLASPGGVYTVFAPTNAAFDKLPKGTVEALLKPEKKGDLTAILKHHAAVPALQLKDMRDGETLSMADGTKVTFHVKDGKVMVNDVNVVATIQASNGVVHVVDGILLPSK
ncbi:MAG: fasciclin domain-containing protein [Polyangiales bacterium]